MISPFSSQPTAQVSHHTNRMQAGAIKVFEEAGGASDLFIPGVGEKYEDLAADFLENWLVNDNQSFEATPSAKSASTPDTTESKTTSSSPQAETAADSPEIAFTKFSMDLDWQISDKAPSRSCWFYQMPKNI